MHAVLLSSSCQSFTYFSHFYHLELNAEKTKNYAKIRIMYIAFNLYLLNFLHGRFVDLLYGT